MNRLCLVLLVLVLLACVPLCVAKQLAASGQTQFQSSERQGVITGEWAAEFRPDTGTVHLMIHRKAGSNGSDKRYFQLSLYRLEGLPQVLPIQNGSTLKFQIKRDAGSFRFEGVFKDGDGSGSYTYLPDPSFINQMREFGYDNISPEDQFLMAVHDLNISLVYDLRALKGGNVPFDELISIGREGVNADFIRGLRTSGIEPKSEKQVSEMRRLGVSESYIREIEALGYERPSADELINMRWMGITAAFIKEIEAQGYTHPPLKKLVEMRFQGITSDFIKELKAIGYSNPSIDQMLGMKLFGVTPGFIKSIESLGYRGLSIELLTCLRIQGITIEFIKQMTDDGHKRVSLRELVRLRNPNGQSKGSCELEVFPDRLPN